MPFSVIEGDVVLYDASGNPVIVGSGDTIDANTRGMMVAGRSPAGDVKFLSVDEYGRITSKPSVYFQTAFGETRSASPHLLGNNVSKYGLDSNKYGQLVSGGGSVSDVLNKSAIQLSVGSTSGDYAKLRTHQYYRYQAGRALTIRLTGYHADSGQSGQRRRWGFFDENDGVFFELDGTDLYVVSRTSTSGSPVDTRVAQSSWSHDQMDGSGTSGVTLDVTKGNIYELSLQWLGVGYVYIFINGTLCHLFDNPNSIAGPYMRTATLPLTWEVENTSSSTSSSMTYICSSVAVEAGQDVPEWSFSTYHSSDVEVGITETPILSIRPKSTFNTVVNRMGIIPISSFITCDGGRAGFRFVVDGSLTGASWSSVSDDSGVEYDISATAISGGDTLMWGLLPNSVDSRVLSLSEIFANTSRSLRLKAFTNDQISLTIVARNEKSSGGVTNVRSCVTWQEAR